MKTNQTARSTSRDAGTGVHYGGTAPLAFERGGQWGHRCPYIPVKWVISWFIKIDLIQIHWRYSRAHKIQNGFP